MGTTNKVFSPASWTPQKVTISASNQSVSLTGRTGSEDAVELYNNTTETLFFTFSNGAGTATTASKGIPSQTVICYGLAPDETHINVIGTGATGTLEISVGKGA